MKIKPYISILVLCAGILFAIRPVKTTASAGSVCNENSSPAYACDEGLECAHKTCKTADGKDTSFACNSSSNCEDGETCSGTCEFKDPNAYSEKVWACNLGGGKYVCVRGATDAEKCANSPECPSQRCDSISPDQCSGGGAAFSKQSPLPDVQAGDLGLLISQFFNWSLSILGIAVFTLIIFSGFQWLTAAGDPSKIGKARSRMYNALLGAILLLSSYIILKVINPDLISQQVNLPAIPQSGSSNQ